MNAGWLFLYELIGCGFETRCSQRRYQFSACSIMDSELINTEQVSKNVISCAASKVICPQYLIQQKRKNSTLL